MSYAYFLNINGPEALAGRVRERVERQTIPALRHQGLVNFVSLFAPIPGREDPHVQDDTPPALVIQLDMEDPEDLTPLFADGELMRMVEGSASCEIFETLSYPADGIADPGPRIAPVSFNVRYHAPVEDEKRFVEHYLESHPPILSELPGVRNVLCYVPVDWDNPGPIPVSNCILGNEVVFDSVDALNEALGSDVRRRLREDYNSFPIRPGPNTHCAMHRSDFRIVNTKGR